MRSLKLFPITKDIGAEPFTRYQVEPRLCLICRMNSGGPARPIFMNVRHSKVQLRARIVPIASGRLGSGSHDKASGSPN